MNARSTHTGESLTYAAIGATQASDLLYYPPTGYRPSISRLRIGSGRERFEKAAASLLAWGVQLGSGIEVTNVELPVPTDTDYAGLVYDAEGNPVAPREVEEDQTYSEDGLPHVAAGVTADLRIPLFGRMVGAPVRVVLVIDEPTRAGFAYGTLPGHPLEGEESFVVSLEEGDQVWFTIRAFSRPSSGRLRLISPLVHIAQRSAAKRYLRALLPSRSL